jgi:hypothetical protein
MVMYTNRYSRDKLNFLTIPEKSMPIIGAARNPTIQQINCVVTRIKMLQNMDQK